MVNISSRSISIKLYHNLTFSLNHFAYRWLIIPLIFLIIFNEFYEALIIRWYYFIIQFIFILTKVVLSIYILFLYSNTIFLFIIYIKLRSWVWINLIFLILLSFNWRRLLSIYLIEIILIRFINYSFYIRVIWMS